MHGVARSYTTAEAAALSGLAVKVVNNAIDKRIVDAIPAAAGIAKRHKPRALTDDGILCLTLWSEVGAILSQERRERLFKAILANPRAKTVKADNLLIVDVAEARRQIAARARDLEAADGMIERKKGVLGNEPVFKGTRIPVRLIAAMLADGASEDELLDGYPKLDRRQLALARVWVAAYPGRGRPRSLARSGFKETSRIRSTLKDAGTGAA